MRVEYDTKPSSGGLVDSLMGVLRLRMALSGIQGSIEQRGELVARYRDYYDGEHTSKLTDAMRAMLRLTKREIEFCHNYMPLVVDLPANRLRVTGITSQNGNQDWLNEVLADFDQLQRKVHRAMLLDGDTYVMVGWDNTKERVYLSHEMAYDGYSGIIPFYVSDYDPSLVAVCKVWHELVGAAGPGEGIKVLDRVRVNVYYPDRVEKYVQLSGGSGASGLLPFVDTDNGETEYINPWVDRSGLPLGIPIVHFANRPRGVWGISELSSVMSLQDILNRLLSGLTIAGEKSAFSNRYAVGFNPDPRKVGVILQPGDWIIAGEDGIDNTQQVQVGTLDSGDLSQLMELSRYIRKEIGNVTSTPAPELMDADVSGETLKMREGSFVSKVEDVQAFCGRSWIDGVELAHAVQNAFGPTIPDDVFALGWKPAELRDDATRSGVLLSSLKYGVVSKAAALRELATLYNWSGEEIERIRGELVQEAQEAASSLASRIPDFSNSPDDVFGLEG